MNKPVKAPLFEALSSYRDKGLRSFHMPAGGPDLPAFSKLDVTELKTTDDLNDPSEHGPVRKAQSLAARFFGAKESRFLTEGSSQGIFAVLMALAGEGGSILLPRPIHRAFVYAAQRFSLNVHFATATKEGGQSSPLSYPELSDYEAVLKRHPEIRLVVATAPDYYGHIVALESLEELCRKYNCLLFVDAAHSAHLHVLPQWRLYGDVQVMSAHKTLPAVTPAAYLHVKREDFLPRLDAALAVLRTSSPPLYVAAAADWARAYLEAEGKVAFLRQNKAIQELRDSLPPEMKVLGDSFRSTIHRPLQRDPLRLVIDFSHYTSGHEAEAFLRRKGIQCEFSDLRRCVFIPSLLTEAKA